MAVASMTPYLLAKVDDARGIALVRGREARRVCRLLSPEPPKWSASGGGWIVPAAVVADLVAYAQSIHEFVVLSARKEVVK